MLARAAAFLAAVAHEIVHIFHWQRGYVVAATDDRGVVWVGYCCDTCQRLTGIHPTGTKQPGAQPRPRDFS